MGLNKAFPKVDLSSLEGSNVTIEGNLSDLEAAIAEVKTSADNAWTYAVMGYNSAEEAKTNSANANTAAAANKTLLENSTYGLSAIRTLANNASTYSSNVNSRLTSTRAGYLDKLNTGVPTAINGAIGLTGSTSKIANSSVTIGSWSGKGRATISIVAYNEGYSISPTITIDGVVSALYNGNTAISDAFTSKAPFVSGKSSSTTFNRVFQIEVEFDTSLTVAATGTGASESGYVNVTVELK